jgi:hypothetical protein
MIEAHGKAGTSAALRCGRKMNCSFDSPFVAPAWRLVGRIVERGRPSVGCRSPRAAASEALPWGGMRLPQSGLRRLHRVGCGWENWVPGANEVIAGDGGWSALLALVALGSGAAQCSR